MHTALKLNDAQHIPHVVLILNKAYMPQGILVCLALPAQQVMPALHASHSMGFAHLTALCMRAEEEQESRLETRQPHGCSARAVMEQRVPQCSGKCQR